MTPPLSCALAVGGLDPGGGAGIAADLRAFQAAGAFGCAAVAVATVQSTRGMQSSRALPARALRAQIDEVLAHQDVRAVKVGALGSRENVLAVHRALDAYPSLPVVLDTPIRPSRGRGRLFAADAVRALRATLIPRAALVTINADEARVIAGRRATSVRAARQAASALLGEGARAVLVKGGHMRGHLAIDVLAVGDRVIELRAERLRLPPVHGTGCTLASLIAGRIAAVAGGALTPAILVAAARWAKRVHHAELARARRVGEGASVMAFARATHRGRSGSNANRSR